MSFSFNLLGCKIWHSPWSVVKDHWLVGYTPEIGKHCLWRVIASHKNIVWLHVPMPDAMLVKEGNRL